MQKSSSLKYEPFSELLHINVEQFALNASRRSPSRRPGRRRVHRPGLIDSVWEQVEAGADVDDLRAMLSGLK